MTTTSITDRPAPHLSSAGIKLFAGTVAGLSAALITSSLLYLFWFIPLGRPGSHIPTADQIVPTIQVDKDPRTPEELRKAAESVRSGMESRAKYLWTPLEVLILTSTCLVAAFFASLYGREQDEGEGKPVGTLMLPTMIGTAAGAVVLWILFYSLVAKPAEAHPSHHEAAAPMHGEPGPAKAIADHGSAPPAPLPRTEAVEEEHASEDWSGWLVENVHPAELFSFLLGTIVAAAVGVLAPRGTARTTTTETTADAHSVTAAH